MPRLRASTWPVAAFDDKYGFEPSQTPSNVLRTYIWWLGVQFDAKKLQISSRPTTFSGMIRLIKLKTQDGDLGRDRSWPIKGQAHVRGIPVITIRMSKLELNYASVRINSAINRSLNERKFLFWKGSAYICSRRSWSTRWCSSLKLRWLSSLPQW